MFIKFKWNHTKFSISSLSKNVLSKEPGAQLLLYTLCPQCHSLVHERDQSRKLCFSYLYILYFSTWVHVYNCFWGSEQSLKREGQMLLLLSMRLEIWEKWPAHVLTTGHQPCQDSNSGLLTGGELSFALSFITLRPPTRIPCSSSMFLI